MNESEVLHKIEEFLRKEDIDVTFMERTENSSFDHLVVFIGADLDDRPYILNITAEGQILDPKKDSGIFRIPFQVKFPFKIAEFSFSQVSNLIALMNRYLELPGIELNEVDREIFYRHVLIAHVDGLKAQIILGIIGNVRLVLDTHLKSIESVAAGLKTYDQLLQESINASS